jgi:hypothetical protein
MYQVEVVANRPRNWCAYVLVWLKTMAAEELLAGWSFASVSILTLGGDCDRKACWRAAFDTRLL